jgi:hypothetical protein
MTPHAGDVGQCDGIGEMKERFCDHPDRLPGEPRGKPNKQNNEAQTRQLLVIPNRPGAQTG